jgi:hypothetical protein
MTTKQSFQKALMAAGALALFATPAANAIPTLKLSDGVTTVIVGDGSGGDLSAPVGSVTFIGVIGTWIVNVSTGISDPILGSPTDPHMDLNSVNVNVSGGAGTLTIWFSDDFFGPTSQSMDASIGGTINLAPGSTLNYTTYASGTNALFAETSPLTSQSFTAGSFSGDASGSFPTSPFPAPYSLTQKVEINHSAQGSTSFNASQQVPDGGTTVALLGFALLGVEGLRRKLRLA